MAKDIASIEVGLAHSIYHHGWWPLERPVTPIAAQMNIAYALAVAAIDGSAMLQQFAPSRINADDVWALIPRVNAYHDPEYDVTPQEAGGERGLVRVRFTDGQCIEVGLKASRAVTHPATAEEIYARFRTLTDGLIESGRQEAIGEAVLSLERLPNLDKLLSDLAAPVRAAF